jgi:hypothetical protein
VSLFRYGISRGDRLTVKQIIEIFAICRNSQILVPLYGYFNIMFHPKIQAPLNSCLISRGMIQIIEQLVRDESWQDDQRDIIEAVTPNSVIKWCDNIDPDFVFIALFTDALKP